MMRHRTFAALLCAALAFAAAAPAQDKTSGADGSEILVTGIRDMEGEVRDFVGALTIAQAGRISRFERSICPAALGVTPGQKQAIVARMRRVAEAAHIAVGKAKCMPNVLLVVTDDKAGFLEALLKKYPGYFGGLSSREVRKLVRAPGPAAVWHVQGPQVDADGEELTAGHDGIVRNRTTRSPSRITSPARPQFDAAAVVVEAGALDGLTITQLADYAAMRALARSDPSKLPGTAPTILKVLETPMGQEVPITLTSWDLALLRSLYRAPANLSAAAQRSSIRRGVKEQLESRETRE